MKRGLSSVTMLVMLLCFTQAFALPVEQPLEDPVLEARAKTLFKEIRCVVCQSESINDSNADLAADLRALVRKKVSAGQSDEAIMSYLYERYGEAVFLEPPISDKTYLLWWLPFFFVGVGAVVMFRLFSTSCKK